MDEPACKNVDPNTLYFDPDPLKLPQFGFGSGSNFKDQL